MMASNGHFCGERKARLGRRLGEELGPGPPQARTFTQMPHPMHSSSEIHEIFELASTSTHSLPACAPCRRAPMLAGRRGAARGCLCCSCWCRHGAGAGAGAGAAAARPCSRHRPPPGCPAAHGPHARAPPTNFHHGAALLALLPALLWLAPAYKKQAAPLSPARPPAARPRAARCHANPLVLVHDGDTREGFLAPLVLVLFWRHAFAPLPLRSAPWQPRVRWPSGLGAADVVPSAATMGVRRAGHGHGAAAPVAPAAIIARCSPACRAAHAGPTGHTDNLRSLQGPSGLALARLIWLCLGSSLPAGGAVLGPGLHKQALQKEGGGAPRAWRA